jgi:hypothetical protein
MTELRPPRAPDCRKGPTAEVQSEWFPTTAPENERMSKHMPMYFFHIRRDNHVYVDPDGAELAGMPAALVRARVDALMISRWLPVVSTSHQWIEIEDASGATLVVVRNGFAPLYARTGRPKANRKLRLAPAVATLQ